MTFNPADYGAMPVKPTSGFDPTKYGAKLVQQAPTPIPAIQAPPKSTADQIWEGIVGGATGITNALGLGGAVDTIGTNLANIGNVLDPRTSLDQKIAVSKELPQTTLKQNVGAGLQVGATAAGIAAGQPESLAGSSALFGGLGAAQAGGGSLAKGDDVKTAAQKAFVGGLTGAAVGAAGYGIQKGVDTLANVAPEKLYNNAINVSNKIKAAGKSPSAFLADEGVWGGLGSMSKQVQDGIHEESANIAEKVAQTSGGVSFADIKGSAIKELSSRFSGLYSKPEIEALVDSVPVAGLKNATGEVSWESANTVRQQLGRLIGDTKWLQTTPTETTSAAQAVYRALSTSIKDATDSTEEFARLSSWLEANKAITKALLQADRKWGLGLLDTISAGAGAAAGIFGGNPIAGGAAAVATERALRSPAVQTGAAQLLSKVPQVGGSVGRGLLTGVAAGNVGQQ